MPGGIFLHDPRSGGLTEMPETPFTAEVDFQKLLADHPNLLAGDQIDPEAPRRWILVAREVGIPDQEDGGARWALDHLFLDQDGIPTLVEVKRGRDPRGRREVVGQMLDYAANAIAHWSAETIQTWFEARCRTEDLDPDEQLAATLAGASADGDFWQRVATNLQAGKVRLIFVSDEIPPELRRIVELLNRQMNPAEVLAVEIRQYAGGDLRTLVPRVLGQTAIKPDVRPQWTEPTFFAELASRHGEEEAQVARRILDWGRRTGCRIWWGRGRHDGSFFPFLDHGGDTFSTISVWTYGRLEIQFQWLCTKPPFDAESRRLELLEWLNAIEGVSIPPSKIDKRPSLPLQVFTRPGTTERFLEVLDWLVAEIRRG